MKTAMNQAPKLAKSKVDNGVVVIDTETTSLTGQVIEIAIVCAKTLNVLFSSYVKPTEKISEQAFLVHGISDQDVENAPTFKEVSEKITEILGSRKWTAYNLNFDLNAMKASTNNEISDCYNWLNQHDDFCIMYDIAAAYIGSTNRHGSLSLHNAMLFYNLEFIGKAHSAAADALAAASVLNCIANENPQP